MRVGSGVAGKGCMRLRYTSLWLSRALRPQEDGDKVTQSLLFLARPDRLGNDAGALGSGSATPGRTDDEAFPIWVNLVEGGMLLTCCRAFCLAQVAVRRGYQKSNSPGKGRGKCANNLWGCEGQQVLEFLQGSVEVGDAYTPHYRYTHHDYQVTMIGGFS